MRRIAAKMLGLIELLVLLLSLQQHFVNTSLVDAFTFTTSSRVALTDTRIRTRTLIALSSTRTSTSTSTSTSSINTVDKIEKHSISIPPSSPSTGKSTVCDSTNSSTTLTTTTTKTTAPISSPPTAPPEPPREQQEQTKRRKALASKSRIFSTIDSLIKARNVAKCTTRTKTEKKNGSKTSKTSESETNMNQNTNLKQRQQQQQQQRTKSMGILGEVTESTLIDKPQKELQYKIPDIPKPGTILAPQKASLTKASLISKPSLKDHISITVGRPGVNDAEIANLRLSVFNEYSIDNNCKDWIGMSCDVIEQRRNRGATCICASVNYIDDRNEDEDVNFNINIPNHWIVGSLECSTHEFIGTELGIRRPLDNILYLTEVAVSPKTRRNGVGKLLLKGIDELARKRNVETLYLHVDVENIAACSLYKQAGYEILDSKNKMYAQFTTKLNLHDGATKGRRHHLMHKKLTENQTWYPPLQESSSLSPAFKSCTTTAQTGRKPLERGTLGFEVA